MSSKQVLDSCPCKWWTVAAAADATCQPNWWSVANASGAVGQLLPMQVWTVTAADSMLFGCSSCHQIILQQCVEGFHQLAQHASCRQHTHLPHTCHTPLPHPCPTTPLPHPGHTPGTHLEHTSGTYLPLIFHLPQHFSAQCLLCDCRSAEHPYTRLHWTSYQPGISSGDGLTMRC
jgi:hypothetical protein